MKKKFLALFLAAALAVTAGALLSACGGDAVTEPEHTTHYDVNADGKCDKCDADMANHTHIYSVKWEFDETSHWHKATCAHTDEVDSKAAHDIGTNGICTACKQYDPSPVAADDGVYSFEAEYAILADPDSVSNQMVVEVDRTEFTEPGDDSGEKVTDVGYFGGSGNAGQTVTWKFKAASAGTVTLTLRASSAVGEWSARSITAIDMGEEGAPSLTINEAPIDFTGKQIGVTRDDFTQEDMSSGRAYSNFTEIEMTIDLVAGDNTVVMTSGTKGCNLDKIMITTDIELTFLKTNNNSRNS